MQDTLRKKWGFDGVVITDYATTHELIAHGVAETMPMSVWISICNILLLSAMILTIAKVPVYNGIIYYDKVRQVSRRADFF